MARTARRERGAAAVEMAIVLPVLLLVVGGLIDLGRAYMLSITTTNAAREGARALAMGSTTAVVTSRVDLAMGTKPNGTDYAAGTDYTVSAPACSGGNATVTITITSTGFSWIMLNFVPSLVGASMPAPSIQSTGTMACV
jgi:hypothetical protein